MEITGVSFDLILTLMSEVGIESVTEKFPNKKHFTSWLGLCPNKKVSGGKVLSSKVGKGNRNLRNAFLASAVGAAKVKESALCGFYNRIKSRQGSKVAKMATAKKIAEIVYTMLKNHQAFDYKRNEDDLAKKKIYNIKRINRLMQIHGIDKKDIA